MVGWDSCACAVTKAEQPWSSLGGTTAVLRVGICTSKRDRDQGGGYCSHWAGMQCPGPESGRDGGQKWGLGHVLKRGTGRASPGVRPCHLRARDPVEVEMSLTTTLPSPGSACRAPSETARRRRYPAPSLTAPTRALASCWRGRSGR